MHSLAGCQHHEATTEMTGGCFRNTCIRIISVLLLEQMISSAVVWSQKTAHFLPKMEYFLVSLVFFLEV